MLMVESVQSGEDDFTLSVNNGTKVHGQQTLKFPALRFFVIRKFLR